MADDLECRRDRRIIAMPKATLHTQDDLVTAMVELSNQPGAPDEPIALANLLSAEYLLAPRLERALLALQLATIFAGAGDEAKRRINAMT
jgi:hypothetical protein